VCPLHKKHKINRDLANCQFNLWSCWIDVIHFILGDHTESWNSTVFCILLPCYSVEVCQHFWGIYHLHLQFSCISKASNEQWAVTLLFAGFFLGLVFGPESGDNTFLQIVGGLCQAVLCYNPEDHPLHSHQWGPQIVRKATKDILCVRLQVLEVTVRSAGIFHRVVWKKFGVLVWDHIA
jgi:hypothetical protein